MQIFYELNFNNQAEGENPPFGNLSLAFGFFDGVHLGHQAVIKSAVDFARENSTKSAVITFQDHPCCFFRHLKPQYIIRRSDKIKMFEKLCVDYLFMLKFDDYLAMMTASDYLKNVIVKNFAPAAISTGFNHFFGANKTGNVKFLKENQAEFGYKYFEIQPLMKNGKVISSTAIRNDISEGEIEAANAMLGYDYFLEGIVQHGDEIGRTIGFNTANLVYPENLVDVSNGVYKVSVEYNGKTYSGIANYGIRPTVSKDEKKILEVHILDFNEDIYGETIKVIFHKKIRNEKKFNSLEELKAQIQKDIEVVKVGL